MSGRFERLPRVVVAAMLVVVLLVSLALAGVSGSSADSSVGTAGAVGRAGFAYLGGLRTFAAAVLWNRIEPVFHGYYEGVPLKRQQYMVPSLYLVTVLDPQFTQAYYLSSFMVFEMVGPDDGIAIAREGVENNPKAGLLHANLAQLLYVDDRQANREEILAQIDAALDPKAAWLDDDERYEGYVLSARMLETMGFRERAAQIDSLLARMSAAGLGEGDHDHDGDGKQDH